jgi:hypothetical protein
MALATKPFQKRYCRTILTPDILLLFVYLPHFKKKVRVEGKKEKERGKGRGRGTGEGGGLGGGGGGWGRGREGGGVRR